MIPYISSVLTLGTIFCILALALNVRYGWTGELDISLFAYVAIGAYISGVTTLPPSKLPPPDHYILGLSQPFLVGVVLAMVVCGMLSLLVGSIALRSLRGDHFAITTVATTLIIYAVISQVTYVFNGFEGLYGLPQPFNQVLASTRTPIRCSISASAWWDCCWCTWPWNASTTVHSVAPSVQPAKTRSPPPRSVETCIY